MQNSKIFAYALTCTSFATINYLLNSYSFVKENIMQNFDMTQTGIGLTDSLRLIGVIIGLIIYTFNPFMKQKYVTYYCVTSIAYALLFLLIPLFYSFGLKSSVLIYTVNFFAGIIKAPDWVLLLQIINDPKYYDEKDQSDKFKLIIWSSLNNLGTIAALIISSVMMYNLNFEWTICIYTGSFLVIIFSIVIKLSFSEKTEGQKDLNGGPYNRQNGQNESNLDKNFNFSDSFGQIINFICIKQNNLFLIGLILLTGIQQVTMMFLPLFLKISGYSAYSGYVTAGFMGFFILGALTFSFFANSINLKHQKSSHLNQYQILNQLSKNSHKSNLTVNKIQVQLSQSKSLKFEYAKTLSLFLLTICMLLLTINQFVNQSSTLTKQNVYAYAILISLSGFFIGGPLSQYESFQIISIINQSIGRHAQKQNIQSRLNRVNMQNKLKLRQSQKNSYSNKLQGSENENGNEKQGPNDNKQEFYKRKDNKKVISTSSQLVQKSNFIKKDNFQLKKQKGQCQQVHVHVHEIEKRPIINLNQQNKIKVQSIIKKSSGSESGSGSSSQHDSSMKQPKFKKFNSHKAQNGKISLTLSQILMGFIQFANYLVVIPFLIIAGKILQQNLNFFFLFLALLCVFALGVDFIRLFLMSEKSKQIKGK